MAKKIVKEAVVATPTIDLGDYLPFYLIAIANRWTATSSRTYLQKFGIGIVEWRIMASLLANGAASSLDVVNMVGTDPASVSKAIRNLEAKGLATPVKGKFAGRTKPYELTEAGRHLSHEMEVLALRREELLMAQLDGSERRQLLDLIKKLHAQLPKLNDLPSD